MNRTLTIIFFEDYFVCSILPKENCWEAINVNGSDKMLLYFYKSGSGIRNDDFAKQRFEANDENAFGDFYKLISISDETLMKDDLKFESIHLLDEVIEQIKKEFRKRIMQYFADFDLSAKIPINICFIPGINNEVIDIICNYFELKKFIIFSKADYYESFLKILQSMQNITHKMNLSIIESYFGDMILHFFEYNDKIIKSENDILIGKGIDYRIGNLAKLIVNKVILKATSQIYNNKDLLAQEIKEFHRKAALEINNFYHGELDLFITLSDGSSKRVIIDQDELEKISSEPFPFIKSKYESFISKHSSLEKIEKIILNGDVLSSNEFVHSFEKLYGGNKIIKPFANFPELLSRGIFALAPVQKINEDDRVIISETDKIQVPLVENLNAKEGIVPKNLIGNELMVDQNSTETKEEQKTYENHKKEASKHQQTVIIPDEQITPNKKLSEIGIKNPVTNTNRKRFRIVIIIGFFSLLIVFYLLFSPPAPPIPIPIMVSGNNAKPIDSPKVKLAEIIDKKPDKPEIKYAPIVKQTKQELPFDNGKYYGFVKDKKRHGQGTFTYAKKGTFFISVTDSIKVEVGDSIVGKWNNDDLVSGFPYFGGVKGKKLNIGRYK